MPLPSNTFSRSADKIKHLTAGLKCPHVLNLFIPDGPVQDLKVEGGIAKSSEWFAWSCR